MLKLFVIFIMHKIEMNLIGYVNVNMPKIHKDS